MKSVYFSVCPLDVSLVSSLSSLSFSRLLSFCITHIHTDLHVQCLDYLGLLPGSAHGLVLTLPLQCSTADVESLVDIAFDQLKV